MSITSLLLTLRLQRREYHGLLLEYHVSLNGVLLLLLLLLFGVFSSSFFFKVDFTDGTANPQESTKID